VLDHGHLGIAADALDQALAAARDDHVHKLRHGDELAHGLAVGGLHQLHRVLWQARLGQRLLHDLGQRLVRINSLGAAAQDAGIAALDAEAGRFDGHVGPALVDHAEHTNWHTHLAHADAAGLLLHANDLANDVGHGGQLLAALGTGLQHLGAKFEAVHHGLGQTGGAGALQIAGVVDLQSIHVLAQQPGQRLERFVFDSCWRFGHQRRGCFCL
jgi:hypothetical protein